MSIAQLITEIHAGRGKDDGKVLSESQKAVDKNLKSMESLKTLPTKHLVAFVAYTDLRVLQLNAALAGASDGINMARLQGALGEVSALQMIIKALLGERREGNDG